VQRAVNRLLYGRRDDPYQVLAEVGRHIEAVPDPLAVLPRFAATLVAQLRVPYVALVLHPTPDDPELVVEQGRPGTSGEDAFPMRAHGTEVGELRVAHRRQGDHFSTAETRLLHQLAGQAAVAAEACRSTLRIQRARERLVFARAEERRQLRRDLHDGVASGLVGARMLATAARSGLGDDRPAATLLDRLTADLDSCTEEIRDLVDGLRPAVLDRGLEAALRDLTARIGSTGPRSTLTVEGELADLPAAVEVVAFRIVTEALTNVVKHARAERVEVRLTAAPDLLRVVIEDDGVGFDPSRTDATDTRYGVGIGSIRSRVEEVGGTLELTATGQGLRLEAGLPARRTPGATQQPTSTRSADPGASPRRSFPPAG
jgi:two-component system NarL family sensor kinase